MTPKSKLQVFLNRKEIETTIDRLASELNRDYQDKNPLIIGILIGSFVFLSDLIRKLDFPVEVDFTRLSSYGTGTVSSGQVRMVMQPSAYIKGRDVLVVEDIIDSGYSLTFLLNYLKNLEPASLRLCVLADKPMRRKKPVKVDYTGFIVPDEFLVGYGLDCDEKYRNIPDICILSEE
jgi:hypoxanthine phosphoribosyltransferase